MATCPEVLNATIVGTSETWSSVDRSTLQDFTTTSYLRPDTGAALLPWVYTMVAVIMHLPVLFFRVVRVDLVRNWLFLSTTFVICVYIQGYISTKLAADQVLVWTPVVLIIDASSMLQMFFHTLEETVQAKKDHFVFRLWLIGARLKRRLEDNLKKKEERRLKFSCGEYTELGQIGNHRSVSANPPAQPPPRRIPTPTVDNQETRTPSPLGVDGPAGQSAEDNRTSSQFRPPGPDPEPTPDSSEQQRLLATFTGPTSRPTADFRSNPTIEAQPRSEVKHEIKYPNANVIFSFILFVAVLALQATGFHFARLALKYQRTPKVSWCSPLFQPFGIAVRDGGCHVYSINQSGTRGIACIKLPGIWQRRWLIGTVVGISLGWFCLIVDFILLLCPWWKFSKATRPWTTMILGFVVLIITLGYGVEYAINLPPDMTERVTVAIEVNGTKAFDARLSSSGLRGTVIGWNDGLFQSWGTSYTGKVGI